MSHFRIRNIEVENFRQFRDPVTVGELAADLNVIAGRNEAGKSTLLHAVRSAFFDRYKGTAGERHAPNQGGGSPRVCLEFELSGEAYRLEKVFSKKKDGMAVLENMDTGVRQEGKEAEDRLAELLGFQYPGKGASKPEHQGLAGLLWVEQGSAWREVKPEGLARNRIESVFDAQMQEMLGGDRGDALFARIAERRNTYFTPKEGKPRGEYAELEQALAECDARRQEKRAALEAYEQQSERLGQLKAEQQRFEHEQVLEKAEAERTAAEQAAQRLAALREEFGCKQADYETARVVHEQLQRELEDRNALIAELAERKEEEARQTATIEVLKADLAPRQAALEALEKELDTLRAERERIDQSLHLARAAEKHARLATELAERGKALAEAREADEQRRRCLVKREAIVVNAEVVETLRQLERERDVASARLDSVATAIDYCLDGAVEIRLDGELLQGEGESRLAQPAELVIAGAGTITITPGGGELADLRRQHEEAEARLRQVLAEAGVADLRQAEERLNQALELEREARDREARARGLAPQGLPALEDAVNTLQARLDTLSRRLEGADIPEASVDELEARQREVETKWRDRSSRRDQDRAAVQNLAERLATVRGEAQALVQERDRLAARLQADREREDDQRLTARVAEARAAAEKAGSALDAIRDQLSAENPEQVEAEVERRRRVVENLRLESARRRDEILALEGELTALGHQGLKEELDALEAEYEQLKIRYRLIDNEARALDLLYRTLEQKLAEAREAVVQPIVERMQPWLRQLIPDAEPVIDSSMALTGLRRNGIEEKFDSLSLGTREQLAILIRLAYADLLAEKDAPVMVILDDGLVNSDEERRERMKSILYQAARKYQILMLTCHKQAYEDTGGLTLQIGTANSVSSHSS